MSPVTHLLANWVVAEYAVQDRRTRLHIVLAGVAPDLDGLGLAVDQANAWLGRPATDGYGACHHFLLHGLLGWIARRAVVSGTSPISLVSSRLDSVVVNALQARFGSGREPRDLVSSP